MILALDVGTSSTRATVFGADGAPLAGSESRVNHDPHVTPDGGVEHDPARLLEAAATCIDSVLARRVAVEAVGICTFWHGLLGFDANLRPVTPVYSWADTRSAAAVDELRTQLDEPAVHGRTGCHFHTSYWPAKLRWLSGGARRPPVHRWGSIGELLAAEWFGEPATTISMASATGLFDQDASRWDPELLAAARVTEAQLFPLRDRDAPWRGLRAAWAARWPVLRGAAWYPAVGDGAASNIGSGCTSPDRIAVNAGTSTAMRLVTGSPEARPARGLWRYRLDARRFVIGGALSEGGNVYAWCREVLRLPGDDEIERILATTGDRKTAATVLPFFAGERSPGWNGRARALIAGLTLATTPADILRAALESVAVRLAMVYERLAPLAGPDHVIVASGGALARSRAWAPMLADALGRPLLVLRETEATSRGVALLALEALGALPDLGRSAPLVGDAVLPDPRRRDHYLQVAAEHQRLYAASTGA
jgi:gluconokinase